VRYVIDTSVSVKWFAHEIGHEQAISLLDTSIERYTPDLLFIEAGNALRKKLRNCEISRQQAEKSLSALFGCFTSVIPTILIVQSALKLAIELDHPVQDCCFLAAALNQNIPLVTADTRFIEKSGPYRSQILDLAHMASNEIHPSRNH
jgi:predicted nucleic acid-binding protein